MKLPVLHGYIDRRILVNYTADADVVRPLVPAPFRPKLYNGKAIVGICLIRLKHIKPKGFPDFIGIGSENGAHRIAVEWDENGELREGVFVPRRDTSLRFNALVGGRIFPGRHYLAKFDVQEDSGTYRIAFTSSDDTSISIDARETSGLPSTSIFGSLGQASAFFEKGAVGYSPHTNVLQGLKLRAYKWQVTPLEVTNVQSSFFENETLFPKGSVQFDHALLMRNIEHEWHTLKSIKTTGSGQD